MMFLAHGGCRTPTGGSGDYTELTLAADECIDYCASSPACLAIEIKPDELLRAIAMVTEFKEKNK